MGNLSTRTQFSLSRPDSADIKKFHSAVRRGDLEYLKSIMFTSAAFSLVDAQDLYGTTALHIAAERGHLECMLYLLDNLGASPHIGDKSSMFPLHTAAGSGHVEVVRVLLSRLGVFGYSYINEVDVWGYTPLHRAVIHKRWEVVDLLMSHGSQVGISDKMGQTALHVAASYGNADLITRFLEKGVEANHKDCRGRTPMYFATLCGESSTLAAILDCVDCDINMTFPRVGTCLTLAAQKCFTHCIEVLLDKGASCRMQMLNRCPALELTLFSLSSGERLSLRNTTLHIAKLLIQADGRPPSSVALSGACRLLREQQSSDIEHILHMLFAAGAKLDLDLLNRIKTHPLFQDFLIMYTAQCLPLVELCRRKVRLYAQVTNSESNLRPVVNHLGLPRKLVDLVMLREFM